MSLTESPLLNYDRPHAYAVMIPNGVTIGEFNDIAIFTDRSDASHFVDEVSDAVRDEFDRDATPEELTIFTLYAATITP